MQFHAASHSNTELSDDPICLPLKRRFKDSTLLSPYQSVFTGFSMCLHLAWITFCGPQRKLTEVSKSMLPFIQMRKLRPRGRVTSRGHPASRQERWGPALCWPPPFSVIWAWSHAHVQVVPRYLVGSIPRSGRSPGGGHGNPLQYSCLEHPMDRGARRASVHGVAQSHT